MGQTDERTDGRMSDRQTPFTPATMPFDFVAKNDNNVERVYCQISSFRQSRNKLNMFNLF